MAKTETATNLKGNKLKRPQTETVCGRFSLCSFRFVAVSVYGRSGWWPFRFVAVSVVTVSVCGRYDLLPVLLAWFNPRYSHSKLWYEITYPFQNFNHAAVDL